MSSRARSDEYQPPPAGRFFLLLSSALLDAAASTGAKISLKTSSLLRELEGRGAAEATDVRGLSPRSLSAMSGAVLALASGLVTPTVPVRFHPSPTVERLGRCCDQDNFESPQA